MKAVKRRTSGLTARATVGRDHTVMNGSCHYAEHDVVFARGSER